MCPPTFQPVEGWLPKLLGGGFGQTVVDLSRKDVQHHCAGKHIMLEAQGWGHSSLRGLLKSNKGDDPEKIINHLYHGAGYDSDLTRQFAAGMLARRRL